MRFKNSVLLFVAILVFAFGSAPVSAQETETRIVDQVVAQINDGVLTLSTVRREMKDIVDTMIQQNRKPEEARAEVDGKEAEIIANLINEELILQKGNEIGADKDADARVNQQMTQKIKELNLKGIDALYEEMRRQNINPEEYRQTLRKQIIRDAVLRNEVDGRIYYGLSSKEIKDYFDKNKAKFTKPETVTISEIYLSFAGRDEAAVREKARRLVAELRSGADFQKIVLENSERPDVAQTKGSLGQATIEKIREFNAKLVAPIQVTKAGGVTDPFEIENGVSIFRVDARENASSDAVFDEDAVRSAITYEKMPEERKKYLTELRRDAYIKISDNYAEKVKPILYKDDVTATTVKKAAK